MRTITRTTTTTTTTLRHNRLLHEVVVDIYNQQATVSKVWPGWTGHRPYAQTEWSEALQAGKLHDANFKHTLEAEEHMWLLSLDKMVVELLDAMN